MALARLLILLLTAGCASDVGLRHEPWPSSGGVSPAADRHGWTNPRFIIPGHPQRQDPEHI
jgi:hypothetical protein